MTISNCLLSLRTICLGILVGSVALAGQGCEGTRKDIERARAEIDSLRRMGEKAKEIFEKPSGRAVYYGILPCKDCDGVETTLILRNDSTAVYKKRDIGKKELQESVNSYYLETRGDTVLLSTYCGNQPAMDTVSLLFPFIREKGGSLRVCKETTEFGTVRPLQGEGYVLQKISQ